MRTRKPKVDTHIRDTATRRIAAGTAPASQHFIGQHVLSFLHRLVSSPTNANDALTLLHEIQVHQVELDLQNEQIEANAQEAAAEMAHSQERFDGAPFAYFVVSRAGHILESNRAGAELFGFEPRDMEGCTIDCFLAPESRQPYTTAMQRLGTGSRRETCVAHPAGVNAGRLLHMVAAPSSTAEVFFVTLSDVTGWQPYRQRE